MNAEIEGKIKLTNKGDGYVRISKVDVQRLDNVEEGESVFVPHEFLNRALNRDLVKVELLGHRTDERGLRVLYGKVLTVVERDKYAYAGVLRVEDGHYVVIPDDKKTYITFEVEGNQVGQAKIGEKVVVEILTWEDPHSNPTVKIIKALGNPQDNNAEMLALALERGFAEEHDEEVKQEANKLYKRGITEEDKILGDGIEGRRDFREVLTFTIDPADAKDFDDAISFRKLDNGNFEIGIHIADVSYFLRSGMKMDDEAVSRETSVYLVDRTIPMLPEVLSNDLCSLVQDEERLTMAAVFEVTKKAEVKNGWYGRTLIKSNKRFTYNEVEKIIDEKAGLFAEELATIYSITTQFEEERQKNGALIIDNDEVKFKLDEKGVPVEVYIKERTKSSRMIEELMLLANRNVSKFIHDTEKENGQSDISVYRVDDKPESDRMRELSDFIRSLGEQVKFVDGVIPSSDLNRLSQKLETEGRRSEKELLSLHIARSMEKAVYSTSNIGHYGLALKYYSHFTSPIRRYPDVLIHRILMKVLKKNWLAKEDKLELDKLCNLANRREREATEAERDSIKYKQVEYMSYRVGQTFQGTVSGISKWGIFVEENTSEAQGLIRLSDLGSDYYEYSEKRQEIIGRRSGETFKMGDEIRIKVKSTNLEDRELDFARVK